MTKNYDQQELIGGGVVRGNTKAPSQRQLRVAEQLKHILSEILGRFDFHNATLARASVSISEIKISPDLRHAKVFVLSLGGELVKEVIAALNEHEPEMRRLVAKKVQLKFLPRFRFVTDESFFEVSKIEALFSSQHVKQDIVPPVNSDKPKKVT